ncbi:MAG: hypothetical protein AAFO97_02795 [Pseudomonadota bacterium]
MDVLDLDILIANDRFAVRFLIWSFVLMLCIGLGLMILAHQRWIPLDNSLTGPAVTLAGACIAGLGGFPLLKVLHRLESIRILNRIRDQRNAVIADSHADSETIAFLEEMVRRLYEKRVLG